MGGLVRPGRGWGYRGGAAGSGFGAMRRGRGSVVSGPSGGAMRPGRPRSIRDFSC
jgi:hypothetical protein